MLTLALGIGANLAIFALVYAVLIRPLPFRDPGELMLVHLLLPDPDAPGVFQKMVWSYPKYPSPARSGSRSSPGTALFAKREWSLTNAGGPERLPGEIVERVLFRAARRRHSPSGARSTRRRIGPERLPVAVISHQLLATALRRRRRRNGQGHHSRRDFPSPSSAWRRPDSTACSGSPTCGVR